MNICSLWRVDVKNTHSVTKTEISVFGRQALDAERRRSPSLAGKVLSGYSTHNGPLFKQLNMLKTSDQLRLQELKFYFKYIQKNLPAYLLDLEFISNVNIHLQDTRTSSKIHTVRTKNEFAKKCLKYNLPHKRYSCNSGRKDTHTHTAYEVSQHMQNNSSYKNIQIHVWKPYFLVHSLDFICFFIA